MPRLFFSFFIVLLTLMPGCSFVSSPTVRIATFNTALSRQSEGELHAAFAKDDDEKARLVAEVLQRTRPDIVLLQEVDHDPTGKAYRDFQNNYLSVSQNGAEPINYKYIYAPPVNTGVLAEVDLDGDGKITRPNDCHGYGQFEGQYGMVVLSKHRIDTKAIVSFREALWEEKLSGLLPRDYYSDTAQSRLRLSSKTHAIVPVSIGFKQVQLMISHPTPPVFDGPEDRNGRRNADEIDLWRTYFTNNLPRKHPSRFPKIDGTDQVGAFPVNDEPKRFVVMGDLNADPNDGASRDFAIQQVLYSLWINASVTPTSEGAAEAARLQAGANLTHKTDPSTDTADWNDDPEKGSGNLRVDYVLPSVDLDVIRSGVYWPTQNNPHAYLNQASDHKLVWIEVRLP